MGCIIKLQEGYAIEQKNADVIFNSANGFLLLGTGGAGKIRVLSNRLSSPESKQYRGLLNALKPEIKNWYLQVYKKNDWKPTFAQLECLKLLKNKRTNNRNEFRRGTAVLQKQWKKGDARKIIHVISMSYDLTRNKGVRKQASQYLLKKALLKAFEIAKKINAKSIALPIMTARKKYGLMPEKSYRILLDVVKLFQKDFNRIIICFDNEITIKFFKNELS